MQQLPVQVQMPIVSQVQDSFPTLPISFDDNSQLDTKRNFEQTIEVNIDQPTTSSQYTTNKTQSNDCKPIVVSATEMVEAIVKNEQVTPQS